MQEHISYLRAFKDNYIWLLFDKIKKNAWIVDPGDALTVIHYFDQQRINLKGILLTHHHWDHSGGISGLLKHYGKIPVIGSERSKIDLISGKVREGDDIDIFNTKFSILEIPGHTLDHIAFYNHEIVFCGDTLFSAGCGKIFEGTPTQMYDSLMKLKNLSDQTFIYCGHEYTHANLLFANRVEPTHLTIKEKMTRVQALLAENKPTLPSLLKEEKQFNPFLRCEEPEVISSVEKYAKHPLNSAVEVFTVLREWKNHFV